MNLACVVRVPDDGSPKTEIFTLSGKAQIWESKRSDETGCGRRRLSVLSQIFDRADCGKGFLYGNPCYHRSAELLGSRDI